MNGSFFRNGITVFASESDCLAEAPDPYRSLMHYSHIFTFPLYSLSIFILLFKSPGSLKEYRKYLIWHTLGNHMAELYISILYLPTTYLPHLVFRGSGILKYWNISGLLQFWILITNVVHTGLSVIELFKHRFKVAVRGETFSKKVLQKLSTSYRILATLIVVLALFATPIRIPNQHALKQNLWESFPGISNQVLCYTAVAPPALDGPIFPTLMILIVIEILVISIAVPFATIVIAIELSQLSRKMSKKTFELQKMLLISLIMQISIHLIMLGTPAAGFVYGVYFSLHDDEFAYTLLMFLTFHGSVSTLVMVAFTKPIRHGVHEVVGCIIPPLSPKDKAKTFSIQAHESTSGVKFKKVVARKTSRKSVQ